jgi:hypothetical protein
MKPRVFSILTVVVLAMLVPRVLLAQSDPFIGTWKMNTAKSKLPPGPAPQIRTLTFEAQGDGVKSSTEDTAADGSHTSWNYTANYDSKDNPISGTGAPGEADTVALKRINPASLKATLKKAGKIVRVARFAVSNDGKVLTIRGKGVDPDAQKVSFVIVFDKQ